MKTKLATIHRQFSYLKKLRRLSITKLRKLHDETFGATRFRMRLPRECPRDFIEKRIWTYFCVKNYHYPKDSEPRKQFIRKAREILSNTRIRSLSTEDDLRARRREFHKFSWDSVKAMPEVEVDRWLAINGIYVEIPTREKRQCLFELYHKPKEDLPDEVVRNNRSTRLNNRYVLRDIIIENPQLSYDNFMEEYGDRMPTVSRASYNSTRCQLRKAGYKFPRLKPGPRNPAIVNGKAAR